MRKSISRINSFLKGVILVLRPHILLGWLRRPLLTSSNILGLTKWIAQQDRTAALNDFYSPRRRYSKRYLLYQSVLDQLKLANEAFVYLEFGVSAGHSFRWWLEHCNNPSVLLYGFDTFEGLPERWGKFSKGDMIADVPKVDDSRVEFVKGLFQDTLPQFLTTHDISRSPRRVVHMDADLFSSTLFALTSLASSLRKGDVLIFDEFNVPNHEFFAFKIFSDSYHVKTRLLGAVNNYYQVAFIIE